MTPAQPATTSLATILKELVQMPTITNDHATNKAALDWIKYQIRHLPLHATDFAHNGYPALVLTTRQTKHPKILLSAHLDVVPAKPAEFKFRVTQDRYYGRGVFDMKFAIAAYLHLLLEFGDKLPQYDFGVVITTDEEEFGGSNGAGPLMAAGWRADVVIDPDAITPAWAIQQSAKGILRYRITSQGEAGHGSRTWLYRSAINQLIAYLQDLASRFPEEPCGDPLHAHPTLNIGVIQGGEVVNQVAATAHADIDIRTLPGRTNQEMEAFIREVSQDHPHIQFQYLTGDNPVSLDMKLKYVQDMQAIITRVTGTANPAHMAHGGSEAGYYAAKGIPVLLFEPPGGNNHADGEWIDKQGVEQFVEIIRQFIEQEARLS